MPEDSISAIRPYLTEQIDRFGDYILKLAAAYTSIINASYLLNDGLKSMATAI